MGTGLDWQAWVTLGVIILMLISLIKDLARPDMIFLTALALLLAFGVVTPEDAFVGFSNSAVITVGSLFVVAVGVQNTGAISFADRLLFAQSGRLPSVLGRLMVTTAAMSAFLNNTPIVAMLIPRVQAWSDDTNVSASKLLIPLSYAAILGGMTTLIGTSTNLLVSGLMKASGYEELGMFDITWVGLPAATCAIIYFVAIGHRLLPDRSSVTMASLDRELDSYLFELRVKPFSSLAGQTVEQAGLRSLGEAYLVHLRRGDVILPSSPDIILSSGDILTFLGNVSMLDNMLARPELERVITGVETESAMTLPLYEAVVAPSSQLVGRTLRDVGFREQFQALVLGIQRRDMHIEGPLGTVPIQSGDLLLIEAPAGFDKRWNGRRSDFYLVAPRRAGTVKPQEHKAPLALLIVVGIVAMAAAGIAPIVLTAFVGALAMLVTRCLQGWEARQAIDLPILLVIAAALGIGRAVEISGLADLIANNIVGAAAVFGPVGVLAAVYFATSIMTEFITNNAAAALMLSIGLAAAADLGVAPEAFAIAIAIAASASFLTPIGYQTNLMVMAAGGYRFSDYTRAGIVVNLIVAAVAIVLISLIWL